MSEIIMELDEHPSVEDFRTLLDGVRTYNRRRTGNESPRQVAYFLRQEDGQIVGGVQGSLWGRSVHIDVLWVEENLRGSGHGAKLMRAIEVYAVMNSHPLIYLETTSFQALPFYQGLGYQVFGELDGISEGHTMFFLKKETG
jgi:ribosomal protein S18 acetylase RimI-like enzyme